MRITVSGLAGAGKSTLIASGCAPTTRRRPRPRPRVDRPVSAATDTRALRAVSISVRAQSGVLRQAFQARDWSRIRRIASIPAILLVQHARRRLRPTGTGGPHA